MTRANQISQPGDLGRFDAIQIFPCPGWDLALPTGGRPQWQFIDSSNWLTDPHNVNSTLGTLGTPAKRSSLSPNIHLVRGDVGRCSENRVNCLISEFVKLVGSHDLGWRRQWHPTPVLLPGKSHGWRSLVGCSPWGR